MKISLFMDINIGGNAPKLWGYSMDGYRFWGTLGSSLKKKLFPVGENYKTQSQKEAKGYEYVGEFTLDAIKHGIQECMGQGMIPGSFDTEVHAVIRAVGRKLKDKLAVLNATVAITSAIRRAIAIADGTDHRYPSANAAISAQTAAQAAPQEEPKQSPSVPLSVLAPNASIAVGEGAGAWIW